MNKKVLLFAAVLAFSLLSIPASAQLSAPFAVWVEHVCSVHFPVQFNFTTDVHRHDCNAAVVNSSRRECHTVVERNGERFGHGEYRNSDSITAQVLCFNRAQVNVTGTHASGNPDLSSARSAGGSVSCGNQSWSCSSGAAPPSGTFQYGLESCEWGTGWAF